MTALCQCGCGQVTQLWARTRPYLGSVKGTPRRFINGHGRKNRTFGYRQVKCPDRGVISEHVLIAEEAVGHRLQRGAEVHHVDGNKLNNAAGNLVICQDRGYHMFLHARARIVAAGGNPNTHALCRACNKAKPREAFARCSKNRATGRQGICRECQRGLHVRQRLM